MARYWDLMGEYDAETKTFTTFAGTGAGELSGTYTPAAPGKLKGLRVTPNRSSAASLINAVAFKLTCPLFTPNAIMCGGVGTGIQTAPALQGGDTARMDWEVDQPVAPGNPITMQGANITADTPITVSVLLWGLFETSGK